MKLPPQQKTHFSRRYSAAFPRVIPPVGMKRIPGCLIPDASYFHEGLVVSDVIYEPKETELLKMAREAGLKTFNGMYMLLYQGAASFKIWTGKDMPAEEIKAKYFS